MKRHSDHQPNLGTRAIGAMLALCAVGAPSVRAQSGEVKLTANDAARGDHFGGAVDIDANIAVVGAAFDDDACPEDYHLYPYCDSGSAYVFRRVGAGWIEEQKLRAFDEYERDHFGWSVGVSGDTVMVTALGADTVWPDDGAVYVFEHHGGAWVERQKLLASDAIPFWKFGTSVAIDGDVAAIGQIGDSMAGTPDDGAVYVFRRIGGAWIEEQKLVSLPLGTYRRFGLSVTVSGDVIVGGAPESPGGHAYVFRWNPASERWVQEQTLSVPDGDRFGDAVAVEGADLFVGARYTSAPVFGAGAAFAFRHNGTSWIRMQTFLPDNPNQYTNFGFAVALSSGLALITGGNGTDLYQKRHGTWEPIRTLLRSDGEVLAGLLAMQGARAIVGMVGDDDACPGDPTCGSGAAYVYLVPDCNGNGIDDESELSAGTSQDCNETGILDECEITHGASEDCNTNAVPDECDLVEGTSADCNENDVPDECDAPCAGDSTCIDCNANGVADVCDLNRETSFDCTRNRVPDECDIEGCAGDPVCSDCNGNAVPDGCELDCDLDGLPDDCDGPCTGACCDHDPFHGCMDGVAAAQCTCPDCQWTPNGSCGEIECPRDSIPAVSSWGLAVLALSLLIGAKLRFGRGRSEPG